MATRYVYEKYALRSSSYCYNGQMEFFQSDLSGWFQGNHSAGYNGPEDCTISLVVGSSISLTNIESGSMNIGSGSYLDYVICHYNITGLKTLTWTPKDYDEELGDYYSYSATIPSGYYFTGNSDNIFITTNTSPTWLAYIDSRYHDPCFFGFKATSNIEVIRYYDEEIGEYYYEYSSGTAECVKQGYTVSSTSSGYATSSSSSMSSTTSYIYKYVGSDNIDPTAISATSNFSIGDSCTVNITAGTGKKYDSTVSYVIQYSTNNGSSWSTLTTTTSTSYTFTLSGAMTQVKFRAYAKDNLGFTSSTYVTSVNYSVKSFMIHTSISGAIKGVNPVVAVGGGVRSAKAVVCKGGVIKTL